jgi:Domain of unknown function (DUF222)
MASGELSEWWARILSGRADQLPGDCRTPRTRSWPAPRKAAWTCGLASLAAEMQARAHPDPDDDDPGRAFEGRAVRLATTFGGAGVLTGDVTPEYAAGPPRCWTHCPRRAGHHSHQQRYHDALQEAMRRLAAAGLLPGRAGQPAKVIAHISLPDLLDLDAGSVLQKEWAATGDQRGCPVSRIVFCNRRVTASAVSGREALRGCAVDLARTVPSMRKSSVPGPEPDQTIRRARRAEPGATTGAGRLGSGSLPTRRGNPRPQVARQEPGAARWAGAAAWARGLPPVPARRVGGRWAGAPRPRPASASRRSGVVATSSH